MAKTNRTVDSILFDAERLIQVWTENPTFSMGSVTLEVFKAAVEKLREFRKLRDELRVRLTGSINDTNDQKDLVEELVTRGKSGMKSTFGLDSVQYEQVGGTRQSDRKSPKRRASKSPANPATT